MHRDQIKNSPEVARADQIRVLIATLKEVARVLSEHVEELEGGSYRLTWTTTER